MIERPWRSSSLAREYTASAPSPFNCAKRDAIRVMFVSGRASYHFAAKDAAVVLGPALASLSQGEDRGAPSAASAPCSLELIFRQLERVPQRKLDQSRRAHSAGDFAKRPGRQWLAGNGIVWNALHVVDRRVAKVGVIPDVEEVGSEAQRLLLRQLDVFYQREIPVLLVRAAENVSAQIAEVRGAKVRVGEGVAQCWIKKRRGGERVDVQVSIVDAVLNAPRVDCAGKRAAGCQAAGQRAGSKSRAEKACCRSGIRYRERRSRLENSDAAYGPVLQQSGLHAGSVLKDRQVVAIADNKPMRPVEVREAARSIQRGLIIERGIERGIPAGGRIGGF